MTGAAISGQASLQGRIATVGQVGSRTELRIEVDGVQQVGAETTEAPGR